ncbi:MAG: 30S ribosomal protein S12 methylthiotransferase RimO [Clostridia bacterium]|nr:30S ribosomal protein S12 methylthiotransferase RimO [Clostridia bacterium]
MKIAFVSLGCDKNLVDSENMLGLIEKEGFEIISDETEADVLIVNTCAFIHDAKEESVNTIIELGEYKESGNCKSLIVCGCLSERYRQELIKLLPEVDAIVGTTNFYEIVNVIKDSLEGKDVDLTGDIDAPIMSDMPRLLTTSGHYAYLKIAEGCDNFCTYCIIPKLRGKFRSRNKEDILREAEELVKSGVKELILVAQDVTSYGTEMYEDYGLHNLVKDLCKIEELKWVRLLYCYPEKVTDELIEVIKTEDKVVKYIDMPIQHINNSVLKRMNRKTSKEQIENLINKLRKEVEGICIRTTLIVGFPGETQEQYEELASFAREFKLDRLGAFAYSREEDTPADKLDGHLEEEIKNERQEDVMMIQQDIAKELSDKMVGKEIEVVIEGKMADENVYIGRSYKDAPDVDGCVFIESEEEILTGEFAKVKVLSANDYDLIAEIVEFI